MSADDVVISGADAKRATKALNKSSSLRIKRDRKTGKLSAKGKAKTKYDRALLSAINDDKITVKLKANSVKEIAIDGKKGDITIGAYGGSSIVGEKIEALQMINMDQADQVESAGIMKAGNAVGHEINESFIAAQENNGANRANTANGDAAYNKAHKAAIELDNNFVPIKHVEKLGEGQILMFKNDKILIIN